MDEYEISILEKYEFIKEFIDNIRQRSDINEGMLKNMGYTEELRAIHDALDFEGGEVKKFSFETWGKYLARKYQYAVEFNQDRNLNDFDKRCIFLLRHIIPENFWRQYKGWPIFGTNDVRLSVHVK